MTLESKLIIRKYKPFIVAVTGSVGKTSTKDAIYDVLKDQSRYVRKSEKSMNSEIGLPLTIIGAPNAWHSLRGWLRNISDGFNLIVRRADYPTCLILEIGADHPRDIQKVAKWLRTDIVVITKISHTPVHVEFFKSPEQVFEEKASLINSLKSGGTLILYADDDKIAALSERVKDKNIKVMTFGLLEKATVRGSDEKIVYDSAGHPTGFTFNLHTDGKTDLVTVRDAVGSAYMYPLLSAAAVGLAHGLDIGKIAASLSEYSAPKGRMNVIAGINSSTIIDDTYNSSPDATLSALQTLKSLDCHGRKIAALGDMMELGRYATEEHKKVGHAVFGSADELVVVGLRSRQTAEGAIEAGLPRDLVHVFETSGEAGNYLVAKVKAGDIVLVKGSQSVRMERISALLLKEPQKADRLLVRQEKEWLAKK